MYEICIFTSTFTALFHRYFTHRHTWEDAEKDCREHSAHLSSAISTTEQEFINGGWVCVNYAEMFTKQKKYNFNKDMLIHSNQKYTAEQYHIEKKKKLNKNTNLHNRPDLLIYILMHAELKTKKVIKK